MIQSRTDFGSLPCAWSETRFTISLFRSMPTYNAEDKNSNIMCILSDQPGWSCLSKNTSVGTLGPTVVLISIQRSGTHRTNYYHSRYSKLFLLATLPALRGGDALGPSSLTTSRPNHLQNVCDNASLSLTHT